jgi:hypothetical protein
LKRLLICAISTTIFYGCGTTKPVTWKLLPTETAQVDYVGIIPLKNPSDGAVAFLYGELQGMRKYEISLTEAELDPELRRLLETNRNATLKVREGVLVLYPGSAGRITIGGGRSGGKEDRNSSLKRDDAGVGEFLKSR